jgi:hypothetical protein
MLAITPLLQVPWKEQKYEWPWSILPVPPFSLVPLDHASLDCMGTFFAALCAGESPDSVDAFIQMIRDTDQLIACGGFEIADCDVQIRPACCSGIEQWREWRSFLEGGTSPWFGHDPRGWAARTENEIIIWTDGANVTPHERLGPSIATTYSVFNSALAHAEARLTSFIFALPRWLSLVGRDDASDILRKIEHDQDHCLTIRSRMTRRSE